MTVSYTHLDVYKRQETGEPGTGNSAGQKTGGDGDLTGEAERIIMTKIKK